jgi:hypothetical protein
MNPKKDLYVRHARLNARATHTEFRTILKKAMLYCKDENGKVNLSDYIRLAAVNYVKKKGDK